MVDRVERTTEQADHPLRHSRHAVGRRRADISHPGGGRVEPANITAGLLDVLLVTEDAIGLYQLDQGAGRDGRAGVGRDHIPEVEDGRVPGHSSARSTGRPCSSCTRTGPAAGGCATAPAGPQRRWESGSRLPGRSRWRSGHRSGRVRGGARGSRRHRRRGAVPAAPSVSPGVSSATRRNSRTACKALPCPRSASPSMKCSGMSRGSPVFISRLSRSSSVCTTDHLARR